MPSGGVVPSNMFIPLTLFSRGSKSTADVVELVLLQLPRTIITANGGHTFMDAVASQDNAQYPLVQTDA